MSAQRKRPPYEYLTSRWGGMKLRYELGTRIGKWLSGFSSEEQPLLIDLLSKFYYYSEDRVKSKVKELYSSFLNQHEQDASRAVFIKVFKEQGVGYSSLVFNSFWLENNLNDFAEENIEGLLRENQVPPVLCIVDDFSGSGKTFIKTVNRLIGLNTDIVKSKIYFLVLHITEIAEKQIENYAQEIGGYIQVIALDETKATFSDGYLYEEVAAEKNRLGYEKICERLNTRNDYIFGFEHVEALVAFHYNTPNNTLGLFWQDLIDFCALFPRHQKGNSSLRKMQSEATMRKKSREKVLWFGLDNNRQAAFMAYCITEGSRFSQEKAMKDLGLTSEQISDSLKAMIANGYACYSDGQFHATAKLKSQLFISRLNAQKKLKTSTNPLPHQSFDLHDEYVPVNFK